MYGLPERKQKLFDDACCAFAESVVIEHVAIELGMAGQKLRNKLNPEQPAQLTCRDLIMLTDYTDDQKIINGLLLALDMVAAKRPTDANATTLASCALAASASVGELSQAAIQHQDAKWLPRDERRRLSNSAWNGIRHLMLLVSDLENKTSGASPFLSMTVDFISSGAPVPGFA